MKQMIVKLEAVLIWDKSLEDDSRIAEKGKWSPLDVDAIKRLAPDRAGVYLFADVALQVKYIGYAGAGNLRDSMLDAIKSRDKAKGATKYKWFATNSTDKAESLKKAWLLKYNPPNNLK
jgi:excinuclease UvrABC nuclease subunit